MKVGDQVVIVRDTYGNRNGYEMVGRSGKIIRYSPRGNKSDCLAWDVKLDEPMPDSRVFIWFSTRELQVL